MSDQYPIFWIVNGLIFFANAFYSIVKGHWFLGFLQVITAGMAAVAAAHSSHAGNPERGK